jgi:periplasmic protein TonB
MRYLISLTLAALIFPTAAFATTSPCTGDQLKFCKGVKAAPEDVRACLIKHNDELSEACKAKLGKQLSPSTMPSSIPPHHASRPAAGPESSEADHAIAPGSSPEQDGASQQEESKKAVKQPSSATEEKSVESKKAVKQPSSATEEKSVESKKAVKQPSSATEEKSQNAKQSVTPNAQTHRPKTVRKQQHAAKQVVRELPTNRKPLTSKAPIQRSSTNAYANKVWTALARHKRKALQPGNTQLTFGIRPSGELAYVWVSQSSGNSRVDQMAIATVRKSAPFPQPTASHDGVQSFTIRIDTR